MTRDEQRAYQRGYQRGARWPEHKPPIPPDGVIAGLMRALVELVGQCDGQLGAFDEDDEIRRGLYPHLNAADEALTQVAKWLLADEKGDATKAANCMAARRYYELNKEAICAHKRRVWRASRPCRSASESPTEADESK